jgi:hypothetical protein
MVLNIELNEEQTLALQMAQYRNGETLSHTMLRLAGLVPEPEPGLNKESPYDVMSAQCRKDLERLEDERVFALLEASVLDHRE